MWGWISIFFGIFLSLLSGLISIPRIREFIKFHIKNIQDHHIDNTRTVFVIGIAIVGILGMANRIDNENKLKIKIKTLEETAEKIVNKPDFDANMSEMMTGIDAGIFKNYFDAIDLLEAKNYVEAAKKMESVISSYEAHGVWNLKDYSSEMHNNKVAEFYLLASKVNQHIQKRKLGYEYAKKVLLYRREGVDYYSLAVASYNQKNYTEALENIQKAIELGPSNLQKEYKNVKDVILNKLN